MPMDKQLIKNREIVSDDWTYIGDDAVLGAAPAIVSFERLVNEADALRVRNARLGVVVCAYNQGKTKLGEDVHALAPYLDMVSLVAVTFPSYRNGRGYSTARILREQMGFTGELRAIGEVLYDQWHFMARCGFDAFEIDVALSLDSFNEALGELSDAYQPAADKYRGRLWQRHDITTNRR